MSSSNVATDDSAALRVGIAGLGTVGAAVLALLRRNAEPITRRAGRPLVPVAVSARDRGRDRGVPLDGLDWHDDPVALAADPLVDLVIEVIGGAEGPARQVVETALDHGKQVVTANKALLARHGTGLARRARASGAALAFEASVAGGIPAIKALREGMAGNRIERVSGILNGTCNFILSQMQGTGRDFAEVLREAQRLGYAEADPTLDIDGHDTAHKLAILASLAFDIPVDLDRVYIEGIRDISPLDVQYAEELGYRIKLVGTAARTARGIEQRVHPTMLPDDSPLAMLKGPDNGVVLTGDTAGAVTLLGAGAGGGPTASAVVADLIDLARGNRIMSFETDPASALQAVPIGEHAGACYVRFMVHDQPGVIAAIAAELRDEGVSVEALIQRRHEPGRPVPVVLTTQSSQETLLVRALRRIGGLGTVSEPPRMIRIES